MRALHLTILLASTVTFAFGCDRDNEGPPDAGAPRDAARSDSGSSDAGDGFDAAFDAGADDAGPPRDAVACTVDGGTCYACEPVTSFEHLNACTDSTCELFVNATRLPLLREDGTVPPLP
jgi:hypothetical protein